MSDIELVKACADAMGIEVHPYSNNKIEHYWRIHHANGGASYYCPLTDDAQAMALIKHFQLEINGPAESPDWGVVMCVGDQDYKGATNENLNRAIVECVTAAHREAR